MMYNLTFELGQGTRTMINLTSERLKQGLSKAALARAAELDQALVSKIEAGRVRPYPVQLSRLARALGWPEDAAEKLMEESDGGR